MNGRVEGTIYDAHLSESYNDCLSICQAESLCTWFTYSTSNNDCLEFSSYSGIDPSCSNCLSGERSCQPYEECEINGLCQGELVDFNNTDSESECLYLCKATPSCEFYAFREDEGICLLLEDCPDILPCNECHSGQRACPVSSLGNAMS